jgi:protein TonB
MKVVCRLALAVVFGLLAVMGWLATGVLRTPTPPRPRTAARAELRATAPVAVQRAGPCPDIARPLTGGGRIFVGDTVVSAKLIKRVKAIYPSEARRLHIAAPVRLAAVIGKDGKVQKLEVVSGPPLLAAAAVEAVKQWVYRPVCLNGEPVEVYTVIDVAFDPLR